MAKNLSYSDLEKKSYWTLSELCAYTGYTKSYIYKLTSNNALPYYKLFGKNMFKNDDIFLLLEQGHIKSNDQLEQIVVELKNNRSFAILIIC